MSVAAIILAAGASRRLGQPKQLLEVPRRNPAGARDSPRRRSWRRAGAGRARRPVRSHLRTRLLRSTRSPCSTINGSRACQARSTLACSALAEYAPRCARRAADELRSAAPHCQITCARCSSLLPRRPTPSIVVSSYAGARGRSRSLSAQRLPRFAGASRRQRRAFVAGSTALPGDCYSVRRRRSGHRSARRSCATRVALTARWWPRWTRAARRWAQKCGWDCPAQTGSDQPAGDADWAW